MRLSKPKSDWVIVITSITVMDAGFTVLAAIHAQWDSMVMGIAITTACALVAWREW